MPISLIGMKTKSVASLRCDRHDVERLIGMSVERLIGFSGIRSRNEQALKKLVTFLR